VGYSLNDERLELQDAAGTTTLIFAPQAQEDASPTSTETAEATAVTSPDLDGSAWVLQKLQNKDLIESTNITLEFDGERASGYAGCNGYGGTYNAGDNSLSLGDITATQRGCLAPEGVMEQESTYLETLTEIATYTLNGANLEITNAAGDTLLTFAPKERFAMNPGDLVGTQWRLRSFNGQDLPADTQYTLSFTSDRDASGSTGCRQYTAAYAAEGDSLRFPSTEMTAIDCMRPRSQGQEIDFLSGFTFGVQYRLSADQLEMFPVEGGTLVWEPLREDASTTQEATVWTLQGFAEGETTTPVPNGTTITLSFDEDTMGEQGTVSGSAGCNTYSADYTYAETLTMSSPVTTRIACEPDVMEQEQRFLDLLQNVRTYNLEEQLLLQTEDGRGLLFAAQ
jgi:putative lipoprotein